MVVSDDFHFINNSLVVCLSSPMGAKCDKYLKKPLSQSQVRIKPLSQSQVRISVATIEKPLSQSQVRIRPLSQSQVIE